ncbi:hypothetical protein SCHPADRAFT_457299 [Schizopora paradoxa]|uniref:Uncharacterized protein n=1 Tax=Schizopora paradoxa TaxID=27342 RepID=A0A0H2RIT1_9AGAM|nr:hypothetical protein SCHPADRAFT_457299 [Schizopora paradoxa]
MFLNDCSMRTRELFLFDPHKPYALFPTLLIGACVVTIGSYLRSFFYMAGLRCRQNLE